MAQSSFRLVNIIFRQELTSNLELILGLELMSSLAESKTGRLFSPSFFLGLSTFLAVDAEGRDRSSL
jgi:hypothetical protein